VAALEGSLLSTAVVWEYAVLLLGIAAVGWKFTVIWAVSWLGFTAIGLLAVVWKLAAVWAVVWLS
jgi:hypothetical protein